MLNIVIPMAGRGSRFVDAGYILPKPLILVHGKPMISVVVNNIKPMQDHRFIFIVLKEHIDTYQVDEQLKALVPGSEVVVVDRVTEGAACTVLLAKELINNDSPLMIANSDQWVDVDIDKYLKIMETKQADGLIMTMTANDPKWSYIKIDSNDWISQVVEKKVVSNEATVGIYNYLKGSDFVSAAESMIQKNIRVNNEFYVAPVYDELILAGKKVTWFNIGSEGAGMYGLGIPSDLDLFLELQISQRATNF